MKRLAIITDVHADAHALRDALAQIDRLGCDSIVCAGDLLDWGLFPEETLAILRERRIPCVRGNHDRWAVHEGHDMSGWDLTGRSVAFLESLPPTWSKTIEGVRVAVWHARPGSDMDGIPTDIGKAELRSLLKKAGADVLVVGHTHLRFRLEAPRGGVVVNPGALLRAPAHPMDDAMRYDPVGGTFVAAPAPGGGTFGVLELPSARFTVHRASDGEELPLEPTAPR